MKSLDTLLYRWIGEADESRADQAFQTYYSVAFPALVRHVQHRTGWDSASAEDIAQEALLRFFERAGRRRREAVAAVRSAAGRVTALEPDALRLRELTSWAGAVSALASTAADFRLPRGTEVADEDLRATADEVWLQIASIQKRGWRLLDEAKQTLQRCLQGDLENASHPALTPPATGSHLPPADLDESEIAQFAREFAHILHPGTWRAARAEQHYPGIGQLAQAVLEIIQALPRLRMPTNGYLFEIATSTFLDEIKRQRRKKRGGAQECRCAPDGNECGGAQIGVHPLETMPDLPQANSEQELWRNVQRASAGYSRFGTTTPRIGVDPVARYESEEFLQRFYEYLRAPVTRAVRALERVRASGTTRRRRCRLESASRKFSRMMAVLCLLGEGYTQEEAARRTGLSRNQVKYIVQTVKEAYARFATDESVSRPRADQEGESHVS